jgi:endonuclease-3
MIDAAPRDRRGRATKILEILDRLYPDVDSFLDHDNPFQLLVAVILSAQCTDARVNMVTPALFARAPDARTMKTMTERELVTYIKTCGLAPSKARNIIAMSAQLVAEHGGEVPRDLAALEALPGVGHKTACVVAAQAFRAEVLPVDTHIHRLAGRWQLSRARNVDEVERDLMAVFPRERWNTLHLQLIEFGRAHCTAKQHEPSACPICSWAMSKARARAELEVGRSKPNLPGKRRRQKPTTRRVRKRAATRSRGRN